MEIGILIGVGLFGLLIIFVLLKICAKHYLLNIILLIIAGAGIIVSSFAMPSDVKNMEFFDWLLGQALSIFLYVVLLGAQWAFDKEDYWESKGQVYFDGSYTAETKLESRSMFWGTLGTGIVAAVALTGINYAIFGTHAIALGVIGCIATAFAIFIFIRNFVHIKRAKDKSYY